MTERIHHTTEIIGRPLASVDRRRSSREVACYPLPMVRAVVLAMLAVGCTGTMPVTDMALIDAASVDETTVDAADQAVDASVTPDNANSVDQALVDAAVVDFALAYDISIPPGDLAGCASTNVDLTVNPNCIAKWYGLYAHRKDDLHLAARPPTHPLPDHRPGPRLSSTRS